MSKYTYNKNNTNFKAVFVVRTPPMIEDFLGPPILKSRRSCPVCGRKNWYACMFNGTDNLDLNNWKTPLLPIIDSKGTGYLQDEADICTNCLTVITGKRCGF